MIIERNCFYCGKLFTIDTKTPMRNRRYCCYTHSKLATLKNQKEWRKMNPDTKKLYYKHRTNKNPNVWKEKYYKTRKEIINELGGKCVICGEDNIYFLQVDYKDGQKGLGWRHPRNKGYILTHKDKFQVLCANHHQEKTIKQNHPNYEVKSE